MAIEKGSVSIDGAGDATGSGAAKLLYDAYIVLLGGVLPTGPQGAAAKQQVADLCSVVAELVDYLKSNAEVTVTVATGDTGLQTVGGIPTDAPASDQTLQTKGSIG